MQLDYQTVVDKAGNPQSVLISWEQFQQIRQRLDIEEAPVEGGIEPTAEGDDPVKYKDGGDYKTLSDLGTQLPSNLKQRIHSDDMLEETEPEQEVHEIKLGKRIR